MSSPYGEELLGIGLGGRQAGHGVGQLAAGGVEDFCAHAPEIRSQQVAGGG